MEKQTAPRNRRFPYVSGVTNTLLTKQRKSEKRSPPWAVRVFGKHQIPVGETDSSGGLLINAGPRPVSYECQHANRSRAYADLVPRRRRCRIAEMSKRNY